MSIKKKHVVKELESKVEDIDAIWKEVYDKNMDVKELINFVKTKHEIKGQNL